MAPKKPSAHPVQTMYALMTLIGVVSEPGDLKVRYQDGADNLSIAVPSIRFGIAFDGDEVDGLIEKGWRIEHLSYSDVEPFARVFAAVDAGRIAEVYAKADPNVKTTSEPEEKLYREMIRRSMPVPDRNYKFTRDDNTELTTPDFTWEDHRVAFFMDGAYWHSVKDDQSIIKEIKSSRKMRDEIVSKRKDKVRRDGANRSELASRGWIILSCTDDDVAEDGGVDEVVDMIQRALQRSELSRQVEQPASAKSIVDDLLS